LANGEPYVSTGQLDQLEKLAGWAYDNQMYVMLDLHGMPGSQNGLQQSGHNTSDIQFWNQQDRADATIQAAINHIHNSTYRSVYTSLAICNEPVRNVFGFWIMANAAQVTYTDGQLSILTSFYERSYEYIAGLADPVPIVIHDAYKGLAHWTSFLGGKNTSLILMEDVSLTLFAGRERLILSKSIPILGRPLHIKSG
jgi:glucan 1,3-beta-glucosidase